MKLTDEDRETLRAAQVRVSPASPLIEAAAERILTRHLAPVVAVRDKLAQGDPTQTTAAEYITDALNGKVQT